jgi:hypothetical protein
MCAFMQKINPTNNQKLTVWEKIEISLRSICFFCARLINVSVAAGIFFFYVREHYHYTMLGFVAFISGFYAKLNQKLYIASSFSYCVKERKQNSSLHKQMRSVFDADRLV